MDNNNDVTFLGIRKMARKLDVPVSWLYARTRTNEIPHYKLGKYVKFRLPEIMKWLKEKSERGQ